MRMKKTTIAGLSIIGIFVLSLIAIIIVASSPGKLEYGTEIGQEEIGQYIVGASFHEPYQWDKKNEHGLDSWMYFDYGRGALRSEDYSTWKPDFWMGNLGADFDYDSFVFDVDAPMYASPNVNFQKITKYPSTSDGTATNGWIVIPKTRMFYDSSTGQSREVKFYYTYFTTQYSIDITADTGYLYKDSNVVLNLNGEFYGEYLTKYSFGNTGYERIGGNWADFRIIIRTDIQNMAIENYTTVEPGYTKLANAVLWSKITHTNLTAIDGTTEWVYPAQWAGDDRQSDKILYPTLKDALTLNTQVPDRNIDNIQLYDTLYPSVYMPIEFRGLVGCDFQTGPRGYMKWDTFTKTDLFVEIQVTTCITTSFAEPITHGESQLLIVDPFNEVDPDNDPDGWNEFLAWLLDTWNKVRDKAWFWTVIVIVIIGIVVLIIGAGPAAKIFAVIARTGLNILKTIILIPIQVLRQSIQKRRGKGDEGLSFRDRLADTWSRNSQSG